MFPSASSKLHVLNIVNVPSHAPATGTASAYVASGVIQLSDSSVTSPVKATSVS